MNSIDENTYKKIPLRNIKREIVDYALISNEDYERVMKYKWSCTITTRKNGDEYKKVSATINKKSILLSHFIIGKPKDNKFIIDHININPLDNRRENLRESSRSQNSQNKKKLITETTTSEYIGVSFDKVNNKWFCASSGKNLGRFDSEIDAAKMHDKYVLVVYGEHASTNNLVKYEDVVNLTLEDIKPTKNRDLPKNIWKMNGDKFVAKIEYKTKRFKSKSFTTLIEAENSLAEFKKEIELLKKKDEEEHYKQDITRNDDGYAIINIYNKKKEIIGLTIVDDNKWYELSKIKWYLKNFNYIWGEIDGRKITLHRYLMNPKDDELVDHINNIPYDNRIENLRIVTSAQNAYNRNKNKNKNSTSIYKGVSLCKRVFTPYAVEISHNYKKYALGRYANELNAAFIYNLKAKELFGEFAKLNDIEVDEETKKKWTEEFNRRMNK
jgi:hypothetical protein